MNQTHCHFLSVGKLRAIIGDQTDHGAGEEAGSGKRSGIWYLVNTDVCANLVAPGASILVYSGHRGTNPSIRQLDDGAVELYKDGDESNNWLTTRGTYRVVEPCYIDYSLEVTAMRDYPGAANLHNWCCYMNAPQERGIHFIENGSWQYHMDPLHGQRAMLWPSELPLEQREQWGLSKGQAGFDGTRNFSCSDSGHTFDYPFFFGEIHGLMFLAMVDRIMDIRFFISPWGGGINPVNPTRRSPAWDLAWRIPPMKATQSEVINIRLAIKRPTVANNYFADDAWAEYQKFTEKYPMTNIQ